MQTILLLVLIISLVFVCLAVLCLWYLYSRSTLQRLKARQQRLLAEMKMPDTFVSYLSKNGGSKAKHLNVEIGPRPSSPSSSARSTPSPTNSCVRSRIMTKRPVRLDQFAKYYEENMKDSCYGFSQEFDQLNLLCRETVYRQTMVKSQNMKNRYANILPYEHSLVKIKAIPDEVESSFINANFVPGLHSDHEYIACQAPLRNTLDDFYRMILEQKVAIIVNLLEKENPVYFPMYSEDDDDQIVRELYLPGDDLDKATESDAETHRPHLKKVKIKIKLDHLEQRDSFVIKKIHFIKNDRLIHRVTQFHFNKWVDFGTPDNAKSLVEFVQAVRLHVNTMKPADKELPMVVHCLAGVGRTGTFIAVDQLLQTLTSNSKGSPGSRRRASKLFNFFQSNSSNSKGIIDIYGIVYRLRNWRPHMVQTEHQYAFIYDCVRYILEHKTELMSADSKISNSILLDLKQQKDSVKEPLIKGSQDSLHTKL